MTLQRRDMRRSATGALVVLIAASCAMASTPVNIVLIVADDLGYGDLACYGNDLNETPHIDGLAAAGLRFSDFHSNGSMCTPTRAALMTGRYQQRLGRKFDGPLSAKSDRQVGLPHETITVAETLRSAGFATAAMGKWHLGYVPPRLPTSHGFDVFRGLGAGDGDHHTHIDRWGNRDWWRNDRIEMESGYTADLLTHHSIRFIEMNRDQPFFLYLPHLAIHFPWQGPQDPPHRQPGREYPDDKWGVIPDPSNVQPHVKAMVESIDRSVGRILGVLQRLELDRRTLVVFTSDNGGYLNYGDRFQNISSNGVLRGQKGTLYEGGHRVPAIFYWPETIDAGVTDQTAMTFDLFPTFSRLAGADVGGLSLDGVDLSGLLTAGEPLLERTLYWRDGADRAVRQGPWKLVVEQGNAELYDLSHDLAEQHDLSRQKPEVVRRLTDAWAAWNSDVVRSAAQLETPQ